jgi:hypothetical protein
MRAKALVLVIAIAAAVVAVWQGAGRAPAAEHEYVPAGHALQDYRTSQFAAHMGWMTFRELWFTYSSH